MRRCRWLRYFEGHTDRVRIISMSPCDDTFLSAADDQEVERKDFSHEEKCLGAYVGFKNDELSSDGEKSGFTVLCVRSTRFGFCHFFVLWSDQTFRRSWIRQR